MEVALPVVISLPVPAPTPRNKVMYRMNNLRAGGKISGKMLGSDKGVWVWWHKQQPSKTELRERDMPKPEVSSRE